MGGRLFEGLEQGVEGGVGDLVGLVEDVNFVAVAGGGVARGVAQLAGTSSMPRLVAASISMTSTALPARTSVQDSQVSQGSTVGRAAEPMGLRQLRAMARMRAMVVLPIPRWPAEDVTVGDAVLQERVAEGDGDVVLSDDVGETLGAVLAG